MTALALRTLLEGLIDYAGLFPPAGLSMQDAVRNYARYREGEYAWALGRFVVPSARVQEVPADFVVSMVDRTAVVGAPRNPDDSYEVVAASEADVASIAAAAAGRTVFVEIRDRDLLPAIARARLLAKIRTGGVTVDAFPPIDDIAAFLRECRATGVAFKATAGLHHPLRCLKPLTYEPDAPSGTMHGFVNLFLAAAFVEDAAAVLRETEAAAFRFTDEGAWWRDRRIATGQIATIRRDFALSFGSCSFEEPLADLRDLGWL